MSFNLGCTDFGWLPIEIHGERRSNTFDHVMFYSMNTHRVCPFVICRPYENMGNRNLPTLEDWRKKYTRLNFHWEEKEYNGYAALLVVISDGSLLEHGAMVRWAQKNCKNGHDDC